MTIKAVRVPNFVAFSKEVLDIVYDFEESSVIDIGDIIQIATKHGLLLQVEGGFNPEIHTDVTCELEPGDEWYERNY